MQFKNIVGQEEVKAKLIKSVKEARIAHAQLLAGQEGIGKLALAIAYAQYISCQNRGENDSCGECPSCHKFQKLIHPDLHFVFPVNVTKKEGDDEGSRKGSDAHMQQWRETILENPYVTESQWYSAIGLENKLGIINTGESSEVIKKISLKSFESEYKTMIIWLPERLHPFAANKLLKLIEEPPGKTVFLMVSENPNKIIGTILSRTQIIKVPPIAREAIADALTNRYGISPNKASDYSRVANGNFQKAIALALSDETSPYFELFRDLMRASFSNNILMLLDWVNKASKLGRESQKELISYSLTIIRESFMLNLGLEDIVYIAGEEKDFSQNFSPFINGDNILQVYSAFNLATEHISRNGNPQIIFTDMTMKLVKLINKL
ncbi:MAG TPA: DNA polymerase III subunit delta [Bacteroidales bacterium]|nr:DNA polymerase III subunit delta [Bacteroidales bacterium]